MVRQFETWHHQEGHEPLEWFLLGCLEAWRGFVRGSPSRNPSELEALLDFLSRALNYQCISNRREGTCSDDLLPALRRAADAWLQNLDRHQGVVGPAPTGLEKFIALELRRDPALLDQRHRTRREP